MNRVSIKIGIIIYFFISIMISLYLISYNKFGFSTVGEYTFFTGDKVDDFHKNDFIIAVNDINNIKTGDRIYYYNGYNAKNEILTSKVINQIKTNENEVTFLLENNKYLSSSYIISTMPNTIVLPYLGFLISVLSSVLGYFIFIILPVSVIFIFELRIIFKSINERKSLNVGKNKEK